jgi:hypothetical protein
VTSHSPIICRAARKGSIWRLPTPGESGTGGRVTGQDYERLVNGNILDALSTDFFGEDIERSARTAEQLDRLAQLNKRQALGQIDDVERKELSELQAALPTAAATIAS